jgi:hypothetical protein
VTRLLGTEGLRMDYGPEWMTVPHLIAGGQQLEECALCTLLCTTYNVNSTLPVCHL